MPPDSAQEVPTVGEDELRRIRTAVAGRLHQLRFGRPTTPDDIGARVLVAFRSDVPGYIASIATAIDAGDSATVRRLAHDLTSLAGHVGADTVVGLCAQLRLCSHAEDIAGSAAVLTRLRASYDTTCRAIAGL